MPSHRVSHFRDPRQKSGSAFFSKGAIGIYRGSVAQMRNTGKEAALHCKRGKTFATLNCMTVRYRRTTDLDHNMADYRQTFPCPAWLVQMQSLSRERPKKKAYFIIKVPDARSNVVPVSRMVFSSFDHSLLLPWVCLPESGKLFSILKTCLRAWKWAGLRAAFAAAVGGNGRFPPTCLR